MHIVSASILLTAGSKLKESLCCTKEEVDASNEGKNGSDVFKEKNRRAGREVSDVFLTPYH